MRLGTALKWQAFRLGNGAMPFSLHRASARDRRQCDEAPARVHRAGAFYAVAELCLCLPT